MQTSAPVDARRGSTTYGFVTKLERPGADSGSSSQVPVQKRRSGSKRKGIGGFLAKQHPLTVAAASATVASLLFLLSFEKVPTLLGCRLCARRVRTCPVLDGPLAPLVVSTARCLGRFDIRRTKRRVCLNTQGLR